jgi:hypothetical protein
MPEIDGDQAISHQPSDFGEPLGHELEAEWLSRVAFRLFFKKLVHAP